MRKLTTLILAAGLVLGISISAQAATEFSASGYLDASMEYRSGMNMDKSKSYDPFTAGTEGVFTFDMKSGDVKAQVKFSIAGLWGEFAKGMSLGTDGVNLKTKTAWLDFKIPNTQISLRLGLQTLTLPNSLPDIFSPVMGMANVAAVSFNAPINEMVSLTGFWARPVDVNVTSSGNNVNALGQNNRHEEFDLFALVLPVKYANYFTITPWAMLGQLGKDALPLSPHVASGANARSVTGILPHYTNMPVDAKANTTKQASPFWIGMPISTIYFDPFGLYFDVTYGSNGLNHSQSRAGWFTTAMLSYKFSRCVPSITAWYGSGDDSNPANGSEIYPYFAGPQAYTQFGFGPQPITNGTNGVFSQKAVGTWGVRLQVANISFVENLTHLLRAAYYQGTNSKAWNNVQALGVGPTASANNYLTTKDSVIELSMQNTYNIYDQLSLKLDFSVLFPNINKSTWNPNNDPARVYKTKNVYSIMTGVSYRF